MRRSREHALPRLPRRRLLAAVAAALILGGLALGLIAPPSSAGSTDARAAGPHLLVSRYGDDESTLWLIDPAALARRQLWLHVAHAPGWAIEGAVSPAGGRVALLVVPPGARDPGAETQMLISDGGPPRVVAEGLDLRGGLAWSADGRELFARRTLPGPDGGRHFQLIALDFSDAGGADTPVERTLLERDDVGGLYPVGRAAGGPAYAVAVGAGGSALIAIDDGGISVRPFAAVVTREWSLSPGGSQLAYTEQRGMSLRVMVLDLAGPGLRTAQAVEPGPAGGSASPVWGPGGTLHAGHFGDDTSGSGPGGGEIRSAGVRVAGAVAGFDLPVGWSPDGAYLALRSFDGTGPGNPGSEGVALLGPDGASQVVAGDGLRILGWWHAAP